MTTITYTVHRNINDEEVSIELRVTGNFSRDDQGSFLEDFKVIPPTELTDIETAEIEELLAEQAHDEEEYGHDPN